MKRKSPATNCIFIHVHLWEHKQLQANITFNIIPVDSIGQHFKKVIGCKRISKMRLDVSVFIIIWHCTIVISKIRYFNANYKVVEESKQLY